jgi:hypothetical protein
VTDPRASEVRRRLDSDAELDALLVEYEALLADERSYSTTLATLASVALALVAFVAAGSFGSDQVPVCRTGATTTCTYFRLLSPLAPIVVILYVEIIAMLAVVRSFQIRQAEERIRALLPPVRRAASTSGTDLVVEPPIASIVTTQLGLASLRRGSPAYRTLYFGVVVLTVALFAGVVGFSLSEIHHRVLRDVGFALYGALGVLIAGSCAYWFATGPSIWRGAFDRARPRYDERTADTLRARGARLTRGALGYLVLPRPGELLVKPWCEIGAAAFAYYAVAPTHRWGSLGAAGARLAIAVSLFELLAYQARYQLNDVRGLPSDARHPKRVVRRRLTVVADAVGNTHAVRLTVRVALARLVLLPLLAFVALDQRAAWTAVAAAGLAFVIALPYEWLRAHPRPPETGSRRTEAWNLAVYVAVCPGYALRGALGILLVTTRLPWIEVGVLAAALLLLGGMWVTMTWALEAMNDVSPGRVGAVSRGLLKDKPHVTALAAAAVGPRRVPEQPTQWKVLLYRPDLRFRLVWNQFFVGALALAAVGTALLYPGPPRLDVLVASTAAAICAAWLLAAATTPAAIASVVALLLAACAALDETHRHAWRPFTFSFGLLAALSLVYAGFRLVSYDELFGYAETAARLAAAARRVPPLLKAVVLVALLGKETSALLRSEAPRETSRDRSPRAPAGRPVRDVCRPADSYLEIDDIRKLVSLVEHLEPATLVVDLEPGISPWGSSQLELDEALAFRAAEWLKLPSLERLIVATNSGRRPSADIPDVGYETRARKPFRLGMLENAPAPIIVCGDQILTDGLLAWRANATFVHLRWRAQEPGLPAAQAAVGRLARPFFFPAPAGASGRQAGLSGLPTSE